MAALRSSSLKLAILGVMSSNLNGIFTQNYLIDQHQRRDRRHIFPLLCSELLKGLDIRIEVDAEFRVELSCDFALKEFFQLFFSLRVHDHDGNVTVAGIMSFSQSQ